MRRLVPLFCLGLSACATFPSLDARLTAADRAAPYPDLVPLGQVLAPLAGSPTGPGNPGAATPADLGARVAALNARAAALRGPVIDPATANRIASALR